MITTANAQKNEVTMVDALWLLIQSQSKTVRMALIRRLQEEQEKTATQQQLVEGSLTRAFDELHAGKVHHNARNLFKG